MRFVDIYKKICVIMCIEISGHTLALFSALIILITIIYKPFALRIPPCILIVASWSTVVASFFPFFVDRMKTGKALCLLVAIGLVALALIRLNILVSLGVPTRCYPACFWFVPPPDLSLVKSRSPPSVVGVWNPPIFLQPMTSANSLLMNSAFLSVNFSICQKPTHPWHSLIRHG